MPGPNATATNVLVRTVTPPTPPVELVYAADLNGDGKVQHPAEQLTSVEKIEQAEALGVVAEIDTGIVFVCPIMKAT